MLVIDNTSGVKIVTMTISGDNSSSNNSNDDSNDDSNYDSSDDAFYPVNMPSSPHHYNSYLRHMMYKTKHLHSTMFLMMMMMMRMMMMMMMVIGC